MDGRSADLMASLQGRLLTGLATLVLAAGLAAGGLAFRWAFEEAIEFQDTILQQVGTLAVSNPLLINLPAESDADHRNPVQ